MADSRRYGLTPQLDIGQILLEAQHRWLRPTEVCEILRNYKKFRLAPDPPHKPAGGSLFLFDRKALRYFRKDGLNWRKKKDGKTVREAHERLKAGSIDVLHCYYAHGEDNENFQRRCYWMLDEQYEHIVLVHYREVKEGNKGGSLRSVNTERGLQTTNSLGHLTTSSSSNQVHTSSLLAQTTYASSPSTSEWNGPTRSSEYEEGESAEDVGAAVSVEGESSSAEQGSILRKPNENDDFVVDSRGYQPQTYLKTFTNLQADNEMSYVPINANEVGPEQYSFLGLKQPVQGHFSKQIDGSQFRVPFPNTSLVLYGNRENASLGLSQGDYTGRQMFSPGVTSHLSGSNDLVMQTKNVTISGNKINNNGHDNHTSTPWTEALELCRSGILNNAEETKLPSLQSATGEDILRRQTNVAMETFVSSELGGGQQSYTDAHLQALMGSHKFMSNTPQSSVDQQQIAGLGCGSLNVLHRNNGLLKDLEQLQEPSHQQTNQQRKPQTQNDGNAILLRKEYLEKHEAENDIKLEENPVYSRILRQTSQECSLEAEDQGGLKKMDSFGRWMSREICGDVEDSLVASDSGMYWNTLDGQNGVEEVSSLSRQIQLDADLLEPSLSQDQLFSISDFSPDWAYTDVDTKVLITGTFMGRSKNIYKYKLSCMFGEIEVAAEVLGPGVLRCQAPHHSPGRVPFYVTSSNRLACSEVREFEYRAGPSQDMITSSRMDNEAADEMLLQIRFAKLLSLNFDKAQIHSTTSEGENCRSSKLCSLMKEIAEEWLEMERSTKESAPDCDKTRAQLMKNLLKEKLFAWLLWKINDEGKGPNVLDDKGQGAIHLAAALGYDWALGPIVSAGVSGNFRDIHGWTALHWAANYGREQAVSTLITLGAAPGALTDPSPKFHDGRTPADLASSRGHKGIAGYLAESSLTIHLSNLSINENIMGSVSATLAGEKAVETVAERSVVQLEEGGREDQLALKDSLAAVRNAAQAAARIQAAFRVHSFRRRQVTKYGDDKCGMSDEKALSFISVQRTSKSGNHDEPLHAAAIRIQRKFRGWKGRKEFLIIRQRIVKIQAHVRGHQVRKNYRKIIWSVGIVEKAILRWRRKGVGLRGFRAEGAIEGSEAQKGEQNENDDYDFLRDGRKQMEAGLEKALARVQSMVQYPEARDQYRRLVASSQDKVDASESRANLEESQARYKACHDKRYQHHVFQESSRILKPIRRPLKSACRPPPSPKLVLLSPCPPGSLNLGKKGRKMLQIFLPFKSEALTWKPLLTIFYFSLSFGFLIHRFLMDRLLSFFWISHPQILDGQTCLGMPFC